MHVGVRMRMLHAREGVHIHSMLLCTCMRMCTHVHLPTQGSNAFESRHGGTPLLKNAIVGQIAAKHRVTPAQALHMHTCTCTRMGMGMDMGIGIGIGIGTYT